MEEKDARALSMEFLLPTFHEYTLYFHYTDASKCNQVEFSLPDYNGTEELARALFSIN
jgi:hypothetical protein